MSDFKIIGNPDPVVGKEEFYSVNTFLPNVLPFQNPASNNSFEKPVKWEIYILENGRWRKTKENDKTGKKISYTFLQKSLNRKGIRILARRGEEVGRLNIKTHPAEEPKIDRIELLDKNGIKPKKPLSYGQTVKARVHCLHMEKRKVYVTLWEDDVDGSGHAKANNKNIIRTLPGIVKNGKADVDFLLIPSFAKIANKSKDEGKIHEYYVTTDFDNEKLASKNVDVNDLETPVAPYKGKTTPPQQPAKTATPAQPTKSNTPTSSVPTTPKGEITKVHITDTAGRAINGIFKEKQIRVYIDSKGLIGKEVSLKLYDHDNGSPNDLLIEEKFVIKANIHARTISFDTIPRSLGGNLLEEGAEQELFAEVEVFQTKKSSIDEKVTVDGKVFKQDQGEIVNMVMKVFQPSAEDKKKAKGECFCNKDFEEKDVKKLVKFLKGSETIWEGAALAGGKRAECNISDKSFGTLMKSLNTSFKKYNINTCIQKIHFLAQVCEETGTFGLSEEIVGQHASSKSIYKGRGLLQLTGVKKKDEDLYNAPGPYQDYADYIGDQNVVKKPEVVANNAKYCIDSGAWIWSINKKMPSDNKSQAVKKWGGETAGKSLNELAVFGDKYLELISVLLNGRNKDKGNMPNGWEKRKSMYNMLKTAFFKYNWYHEDGAKALIVKDVVTYHVYENGEIEKHIPKKIESGYEQKYKYVYHDRKDKEHEICIVDKHETDEKKNGTKPESKPTHSEIVSDQNISEGQTTRRIKYKNGDIAEYGSNDGSSFWVLYEVTGKKVELVKMPDSLNYSESDVLIKYDFTSTKRRYSGPEYLAVFIGVLAKCGFDDVKTTGSCFSEASCFPSVEHVNGKSIDTIYLDDEREQKLINAFNDYGITKQLRGKKKKEFKHTSDGGKLHNSHLHSGIISAGKIKIIKE